MRPGLTFSPAQLAGARGLLGLSTAQLAEAAGLEEEAVELYERGEGGLSDPERERLGRALYADGHGVIAIPADRGGEGVRFARAPALSPILAHLVGRVPLPSTARERGHGDW